MNRAGSTIIWFFSNLLNTIRPALLHEKLQKAQVDSYTATWIISTDTVSETQGLCTRRDTVLSNSWGNSVPSARQHLARTYDEQMYPCPELKYIAASSHATRMRHMHFNAFTHSHPTPQILLVFSPFLFTDECYLTPLHQLPSGLCPESIVVHPDDPCLLCQVLY